MPERFVNEKRTESRQCAQSDADNAETSTGKSSKSYSQGAKLEFAVFNDSD